MKKIVFAFASVMMLMACNKAAVVDNTGKDDSQPQPQPEAATVVTLKAVMPGFTSDTKATIADDGTFSWAEGDKIAVRYTKADAADEYVEFICTDAANCEFEGTPSAGYSIATSGNIAFYPSDYRGTPSSYSGSAAEAAKSFQMKATSFVDGKLSFQHDNALLKVTINNIPSVADNIVIGNSTMGSIVTITEGGNLTVMVPSIPSVADNLHIYVKKGDTVLFTKGTTKAVAINAGYLYTRIPILSVVPEGVYLKSSMTGWAEDTVAPMTTSDNVTYTLSSLQSVGDQYAKVYVKYPGNGSSVWVRMGPGAADSETIASTDLVEDATHSVHIANIDTYSFTFNTTTGNFAIAPTGASSFNLYIRGGLNDWAYDDAIQLTPYKDGKIYYYVGRFGGEQKLYYNHYDMSQLAASSKGSSGTLVQETGESAVLNVDDTNIYYEVIDLVHMTFKIQYVSSSNNSGAATSFGIKGDNINGGEDYAFTEAYQNTWVGIVENLPKDSEFELWDNKTNPYGHDNNWHDSAEISADGTNKYKVTKAGSYLFVIHLNDWRYYAHLLDQNQTGSSLDDYNELSAGSIVWDD